MEKTSSEIQEIFGLCRDDIKRLEKDGVLKPEKNGQGKASWYGEEDLNRLLDIKMYLLAGFRISDMKKIIISDYDSNEGIDEQIHTYKKRIQMLEFIKTMRADINELETLNQRQLVDVGKISAEKTNMPSYGSKEYYDIFWDYIKLVFIIDFLSQKESFIADNKIVLNRAFAAYQIIERVMKISGIEIDGDAIKNSFLAMANEPVESEEVIREFVKELVEEFSNNKHQIMGELEKENIEPIINELDAQAGKIYRNMMNHLLSFSVEYFVDETELFYVYTNFRKFVNGLDRYALEEGIIKLGGKNNG